MRTAVAAVILLAASAGAASATSGPGCLTVTNVAVGDFLALRTKPSAGAAILDRLVPGQHGVIHLDGPCTPTSVAWASRWCPVTYYGGDGSKKGWVKARYVRDSECP